MPILKIKPFGRIDGLFAKLRNFPHRVSGSYGEKFADACACGLFPSVCLCVIFSVERPEDSVLVYAYLFKLFGRLADLCGNFLRCCGWHYEDKVIVNVFVSRSPPFGSILQNVGNLFAVGNVNLGMNAEAFAYHLFYFVRGEAFLCGKNDISTVEMRFYVGEAELFKGCFQFSHNDLIFAADVYSSEQSNVSFHFVTCRCNYFQAVSDPRAYPAREFPAFWRNYISREACREP